ncbi:2-oxoglutarate dehydrogenase, E2 component, dihydrolipoamide succinyltransferase [Corynebacterium sp. ED61]|uniref:2-oxoglutarate dehydrogenase, E2 component, dihydrolipoamide succinyltransferase n=1 Tax=Corynebacterium sp. ED61 TaxID=2211360 RepID=UPI001883C62E|nr:2-oxoglutarate dehydrogenase, E2 component, dihydrolipoamide succinyltransferase [Corynebacterium sp. ED61]MBF0580752.1 2-oxoglutarate dehydrogenase, E2 component, dihydrolipoamide succinyltransferase [Corynebacterium sp. ED61]
MAHSVEMPELGESVTEGTVTQWLKQVGDKVEVDEPLLEVSTDKVDTEIPSPVAGVLLEIIADEDDTVDVGAVIAKIGDEDEAGSDSSDDSDSDDDEDSSEEAAEAESADEDEETSEDDSAEAEAPESDSGEGEDVVMPELGESVTEGTITQWLKQPGDKVEVDEPLLEVSTDKVDTEIPSPVAGTLVEILANEDDTVDVGDVIARIGDGSAKASKSEDKAEKKEEKAEEPAQSEEPAKSEEQAESNDDADEQESSSDSDSADSSSEGGSGEAEDVVMPELGESVTEGTITQWLKQPGDKVEVDEPLLEVSTDKVDTEIPSPVAGTLVEILANEDDTVDVGDVIARIGDGSAKASKSEDKKSDSKKTESKKAETDADKKTEQSDETEESVPDESTEIKESSSEEKSGEAKKEDAREKAAEKAKEVAQEDEKKNNSSEAKSSSSADSQPSSDSLPYVTPLVRKLADKHGVDLSQVSGTGVGGRIRKQDVLAAANGESAGEAQSGKSEAPASRNSTFKVDAKKAELRGTTQRVNRIREITAAKTLESLQSTAQLTQVHEVDMTRVAELRSKSKEAFQDKHGVKLTYLPFFAKAMVEALVDHPNVNASYDAQSKEMTYHGQVNLGIAVDTEAGLLSPVIHDAQDLSLPELAKAIVDIADRARNKKLKPTDLTGGTFTITNIGSEGALTDTPILVPPQAAMVGTGAIVQRPIVLTEDGAAAIAIRHMVLLPMTYDHQVIDGADAGRFLSTVRDRLETGDFEADLEL